MEEPTDRQALQPHLLPGESVRWLGRPDPRRLLNSGDIFLIPFSLLWGGFALFWEGGVLGLGSQAPDHPVDGFFALWGVPFVVVGQYFIWGRFVYKRWDRRRTVYAVTDQRVLVLKGRTLQSMFITQLPALNLSTRSDGSGSLQFGTMPWTYGFWGDTGMEFMARGRSPLTFYDIPRANDVYQLIAQGRSPT